MTKKSISKKRPVVARKVEPVVGHSPEHCRAAYAIHKSELGPVAECHFIKRGRGYTVEMNYEDCSEPVFYSWANAQKHFWFFGWIMSNLSSEARPSKGENNE